MFDPSKDPVLQEMARKQMKRLPDYKLQSLEDELRLNGDTIQADEVSKMRFQEQQKKAASVEQTTSDCNISSNDDCSFCEGTIKNHRNDCVLECLFCEGSIKNHKKDCRLACESFESD